MLDALRYAALSPVPEFGAVIFRRTSPQITQEGGLWNQSQALYPLIGGKPRQTPWLGWEWPQYKTRIRFAHMQYERNMYDWQGAQIPFLAFDELTHFWENTFFYMLSRNRSTCGVRPRVRATTNPDADSWVKRFLAPWVDEKHPWHAAPGQIIRFYREDDTTVWLRPGERIPAHIKPEWVKTMTFIPARLEDNPALLRSNPEYVANLMALSAVERERLMGGPLAWTIRPSGNIFKRDWFDVVDAVPTSEPLTLTRYWDTAATEPDGSNDPDATAGVLMASTPHGQVYVLDVIREQFSPHKVRDLISRTAERDGYAVRIRMEQEGGASGKDMIASYTTLLGGYDFRGVHPSGDKRTRAVPFAAQCEAGNVHLLRGAWNERYLNELCAFPSPRVHDDQVDASSGAYKDLAIPDGEKPLHVGVPPALLGAQPLGMGDAPRAPRRAVAAKPATPVTPAVPDLSAFIPKGGVSSRSGRRR